MKGAFTPEAKAKSTEWRKKVMAEFNAHKGEIVKGVNGSRKYSLKDALLSLSTGATKSKAYVAKKPYGSKLKKPLTLSAAQKVLLKYYRDRQLEFKKPRMALRKNIASCHKTDKRVLVPCAADAKKRAIVTPACAKNYKFRPSSALRSGPGIYKMKGLTGLCGKVFAEERKASKLYQKKRFVKKAGPRKAL